MNALRENKQLVYLFLCNFSILFIGFGLFPVLPLFAADFGANPFWIGIYLGITYIAISLGSILAGQLSDRLPRKTLLVMTGLLGIPALLLLGRSQSLWQIIVLTALVWFAGGVGLGILNVLAGLHTNLSTRGKVFGLLALVSPLGALIGGLVVGRSLEWGGYPFMFNILAIVWSMGPVLAITRLQEPPGCSAPAGQPQPPSDPSYRPGAVFTLLLVTVLLASLTVSVGRMGLSMEMKEHNFSAGEVSTANAVGGLVTIPIILLVGALSDRFGRKYFLMLGYLVALGSTVMLFFARDLGQFWVASSLVLASRSMISSMSPAYATDLVRRRFLGKALPLVGTMTWVSGVAGFAGAGYILDTFGAASLYGITVAAASVAFLIVAFLPRSLRRQAELPASGKETSLQPTGD